MDCSLREELRVALDNPGDWDDTAIDRLLRLDFRDQDRESTVDILLRYPDRYVNHDFTSYQSIVQIFDFLKPNETDVVYDLGSGYGRFVLVGSALCQARFVGVEIVEERIAAAKRSAKFLSYENACFIKADMFETPLDDATIIFSFNPIYEHQYPRFVDLVCSAARIRTLTLVLSRPLADYVEKNSSCELLLSIPPSMASNGIEFRIIRM